MIQVDEIEQRIQDSLGNLSPAAQGLELDTHDWRLALARSLGAVAAELGYIQYSSGSGKFTWAVVSDSRLVNVALVLKSGRPYFESEDFRTLLMAKASYRVLVFSRRSREEATETTSSLITAVKSFEPTQGGDRYMFACWCKNDNVFIFTPYVA